MFTAFFLAFGVGALIAILWFVPVLAFGIGRAVYRVVVDVPAAIWKGIREGVDRGNRIADRLEGKEGKAADSKPTSTKSGD